MLDSPLTRGSIGTRPPATDRSTSGASLVEGSELRTRLLSENNERSVRWAAEQVISHLPKQDQRHRQRLELLIEKARAFDREKTATPTRSSTGKYSGECNPGDAVIIETIHKSKA